MFTDICYMTTVIWYVEVGWHVPTIPVLFGPVVSREAVLVPVALIAEIPSVPTSELYVSVPSIWMSTVLANKYRVQISLKQGFCCEVSCFFFGCLVNGCLIQKHTLV